MVVGREGIHLAICKRSSGGKSSRLAMTTGLVSAILEAMRKWGPRAKPRKV